MLIEKSEISILQFDIYHTVYIHGFSVKFIIVISSGIHCQFKVFKLNDECECFDDRL